MYYRMPNSLGTPGLQVNLGIFGTRKLEDFLNPMLLAFVDRLKLVAEKEGSLQCDRYTQRLDG